MVRSTMQSRKERILSRDHIEDLIARGRLVFILDNKVIQADAWLPFHPGGDKVIRHLVGRDATDEVTILHSVEAIEKMNSYQIGRVEGFWQNFLPPIQGGQFRQIEEIERTKTRSNSVRERSNSRSTRSASPFSDNGSTSNGTATPSSLISCAPAVSEGIPRVAYLDAITQKEIEFDTEKYPNLDHDTQQNIVQLYRALHERVKAENLYQCNYSAYLFEASRWILLFSLFLTTLRSGWYILSAIFLGLTWHQIVFAAHDACHMGITHNFQIDTMLGIIVADFIGGLSMGWWKSSHNVHHIVTNLPEHDPDIQLLPFFAVSHRFFSSIFSTYYDRQFTFAEVDSKLIQIQHFLYYPVLMFGRFKLYFDSWTFLIMNASPRKGPARYHRWLEITGQVFFWYWFGYLVLYCSIPTWWSRVFFVLVSHMVTAPLHVQITLSHYAMSTTDLGVDESFPQRMLRTTMDVDCPQWLDFIHGGLQFQAIHHLYPRIPRHNLRRTQKLVQGFCKEAGIPYALMGFVDGNKDVIGRLAEVGRQAAMLTKCHEAIIRSPDYAMH